MPYFSGPNGIREVADPGQRFLDAYNTARRGKLLSEYYDTGKTDLGGLARLDEDAARRIQADQEQKGLAQILAGLYTAPEEQRPQGIAALLAKSPTLGMQAAKMFDPRFATDGGSPADVRSFEYFAKGLTPEQRQQAQLEKLGLGQPKQANAQFVDVPDGQGGTVKMVFDPQTRQFTKPQFPGSQQPGQQGGSFNINYDGPPEGRAAFEAAVRADQALGSPPGDYTLTEPMQTGRMGYVPPKPAGGADAPSGYTWNGDGSLAPIPGGPADKRNNPMPADQAKGEMGMRKELQDLIKQDRTVLNMYQNVQNAAKAGTAASDLSMIFAYMKMLDPGSVVREQEFANAQNAAGIPDRILNLRNQILSGNRLNPKQRQEFTNEARQLANEAQARITSTTRERQGIAEQYGYDTVRATGQPDFRSVQSGGASKVEPNRGGPKPWPKAGHEEGGYRYIGGDPANPKSWMKL